MVSKALREEKHFVPRDELLEHATLSVLNAANAKIPGIAEWSTCNVIKTPLTIYDVNGKRLFLDYTVKRAGKVFGTIRTGASKIMGLPVKSHELGERYWNFNEAVTKLTPRVKREYPRPKIRRTRLVCYSYPKLGVMFEMDGKEGEPSRLIYDVADYTRIPEKPPESEAEGAYAWSFYDSIPENARKVGLKQYDTFDEFRVGVLGDTRERLQKGHTLRVFWPFSVIKITDVVCKTLQFCSHYSHGTTRSHQCFTLHGQQKSDYCAVATCQMILCYYRYYYSQDHIAQHLKYSPGGCSPNHSAGYEDLSNKHLDATYDTTATWNKARDQIDMSHPLKSGVKSHARACAGYFVFHMQNNGSEFKSRSLLIYDPWPWAPDYKIGGSVYWEPWDPIPHANFIYTKLKY